MSTIKLEITKYISRCAQPLPTPFPLLNRQLNGGLPRGTVTELYGPPAAGKTQLILTLAAHTASLSHKVILIDTESSISKARLLQICSSFNQSSPSSIKLIRLSSWQQAVPFIHLLPNIAQNSQLIVIDSIASLFRTCNQSQPHKRLEAMLIRLRHLAIQLSATILVVNHSRADGSPAMGDQWRYICPLRFRIQQSNIMPGYYQLNIVKSLVSPNSLFLFRISSAGVIPVQESLHELTQHSLLSDDNTNNV